MFEISIALNYLLPKRRHLSASIISCISTFVIALVVWLILVFFSVTDGMEKGWIEKLTTITAPIRITPTEHYKNSYYYQIDTISETSNYTAKSIGEKRDSEQSDPHDPSIDESIPSFWPEPDRYGDGELKDLVKELFNGIETVPNTLQATDYQTTYGNLKLQLLRETVNPLNGSKQVSESSLSQASYLNSFDDTHSSLASSILPSSPSDISNLLHQLSLSQPLIDPLQGVEIKKVTLPSQGHTIEIHQLPEGKTFNALAIQQGTRVRKVYIPLNDQDEKALHTLFTERGFKVSKAKIAEDRKLYLRTQPELLPLLPYTPIVLYSSEEVTPIKVPFEGRTALQLPLNLQSTPFQLTTHWDNLTITDASFSSRTSLLHPIPNLTIGEPVLLAKSFKDHGVFIGDRGTISYYSGGMGGSQEQKLSIYVAGFFDPGIIPVGGRFILLDKEVVSLIQSSYPEEEAPSTNGVYVRLQNVQDAEAVKAALLQQLERRGISKYWKVETYREYDFSKELFLQLKSERNIFTLISLIIIIVACSNIISMLIILINDKKIEIGVLRSMGASSKSVALIFGICGTVMGLLGSLIGISLAIVTLKNLNTLIQLISTLQGHALFNSTFYGELLPQELSMNAFTFVLSSTAIISLISGIIPAVKASRMQPAAILRSE